MSFFTYDLINEIINEIVHEMIIDIINEMMNAIIKEILIQTNKMRCRALDFARACVSSLARLKILSCPAMMRDTPARARAESPESARSRPHVPTAVDRVRDARRDAAHDRRAVRRDSRIFGTHSRGV